MQGFRNIPAMATAAISVMALTGAGDTLRCGQHLVERGFRQLQVIERCGEPVLRETWVEQYYPHGPVRSVDEWTYELGRNKFRRLLRFENGRLTRISTEPKPIHSLPR
jgi:hypothetical protein